MEQDRLQQIPLGSISIQTNKLKQILNFSKNTDSKNTLNSQSNKQNQGQKNLQNIKRAKKFFKTGNTNKNNIFGKYNQNIRGYGITSQGIIIYGLTGQMNVTLGQLPTFIGLPKKQGEKGQKRVLFMYSNTGGGHKASADALIKGFEEIYGDKYNMSVADIWSDWTPWPTNQMPKSYGFLVKHGFLWRLTYTITYPQWVHRPYLRALGVLNVNRNIDRAFEHFKPDLVVSVHPLLQHIPIRVLKNRIRDGRQDPDTAFATVVTDFTTCHSTWFHRSVNKCFVPTEECKKNAQKAGLKDSQIVLHGLPIRPVFNQKLPSRPKLRQNLGLDPDIPAVLLIGGGEGMGKLKETVEELTKKLGKSCQVLVVCGRNQRLQGQIQQQYSKSNNLVVAYGFINNLHEIMGASDAIITKAGPGTIAESLVSGLPILLNGNVPCQEEGNIPYVVNNKVGQFQKDPKKIAEIIQTWTSGDGSLIREMSKRSKALGKPDALYNIVRDLNSLVKIKV